MAGAVSSEQGAAGGGNRGRRQRGALVLLVTVGSMLVTAGSVPRALGFLAPPTGPLVASPPPSVASSSPAALPFPLSSAAASSTALFVKREGRRGPGYKGAGGGNYYQNGGNGGGGGGRGGGGRGRRRGEQGAEPSKDPNKRLANLNRKLTSIIELEALPWDELNEEQRQKVERKGDIQAEISRLTKLVRQQDFIEEAAEQREAATSAEDLNEAVVGGRIPRTLLKLLTYCRVSDKDTCEILLELGKVKVNGEVCENPVELVDLVKDTIEFDGQPVTLPETRLKHKLRSLESQEDARDADNVPKDYCARIDGGLLIDLTRNIEKARGTFVDKSPYIMRNPGGGGGGGKGR